MLNRLVATLVRPWLGRRSFQPFWEKLYRLSLKGLNIGSSSVPADSGELWVLDQVKKSLPDSRPAVVFDVGANVGIYATEVLARFKQLQLYCFEPSLKTFEVLRTNLNQDCRVKLFCLGFGDAEGTVDLYSDSDTSGLASVYNRRLEHLNIQLKANEKVSLKTLDSFCSQQVIQHIDLLKVDVEGNEFNVLKGGQQLMASGSIDFIQFEFGGTNIDAKTFFRDFYYLLDPNYKIYRILKDGLAPVHTYDERYEIFVLANFLCISKRWLAGFSQAENSFGV